MQEQRPTTFRHRTGYRSPFIIVWRLLGASPCQKRTPDDYGRESWASDKEVRDGCTALALPLSSVGAVHVAQLISGCWRLGAPVVLALMRPILRSGIIRVPRVCQQCSAREVFLQ